MRTAGQGPGKPSRGRGCAAEGPAACLDGRTWAAGEDLADCHDMQWSAIQRSPECAGASGLPWALDAPVAFFCARGKPLPQKNNGGKYQ